MNVINISSYEPYPAGALSNFTAYGFFFRGFWLTCLEAAIQATKFEDVSEQLRVLAFGGKEAKRAGSAVNWQETGLFWLGQPLDRYSQEYQAFMDELFDSLYMHNPDAQKALLASGGAKLEHTMGKVQKQDTVLTVEEFVSRLEKIRQRLQQEAHGVNDKWLTVERPGYLGAHREERYRQWTEQYGTDNWRLAWKVGETFVDYLGMCTLYEDAYHAYLTSNPDILQRLIADASDIYDDDPSNVHSRFDYLKQETGRTHVQDIAIRRCLIRMGIWFKGDQLVQIRDRLGVHPLSVPLSPGQVPFHRQDLLVQPQLLGKWWKADSAESFYQSNKVLQVKHQD